MLASYINSHDFEADFPNLTSSLSNYQRSTPYTKHRIYLPVLYGILFVVGIVGNAWVLYVIACVRCLGNRSSRLAASFGLSQSSYFVASTGSNASYGHQPPSAQQNQSQNHSAQSSRRATLRRTSTQLNYVRRSSAANSAIGTNNGRWSRTSRNVQVYIMCLCILDLIVLSFFLFLIADLIAGQWPLTSTFVCKAYLASESVNKFCVPFLLVALSGYCYATVAQCDGVSMAAAAAATASTTTTSSTANGAAQSSSNNTNARRPFIPSVNCHFSTNPRNLFNFRSPLTSAFICVCSGFSLVTPVYMYSDIGYVVAYNETSGQLYWVMSKCGFRPPDFVFTLFTLYSFVFGYILPSVLFSCYYISVLRVVYKRARRSQPPVGATESSDAGRRATTARSSYRLSSVAKTTLGLVFFYQLCWTPYWSMSLYQYFYNDTKRSAVNTELAYFVHVLPYINCTGYPIVYTLMNKNIKETYNRIRENRRQFRRESTTTQFSMDEPNAHGSMMVPPRLGRLIEWVRKCGFTHQRRDGGGRDLEESADGVIDQWEVSRKNISSVESSLEKRETEIGMATKSTMEFGEENETLQSGGDRLSDAWMNL